MTQNPPDIATTKETFSGNFTQQEAIPNEAIEQAVTILKSGRLHRYNVDEQGQSETALLEQEFARYMGSEYCLACTSGGYALHIALRAIGLTQGQAVLTNAFTLSPVPGAIVNAGGQPVLVETTENLVIDLEDLVRKIDDSGARVLMLSHMRGHLVDMDQLMQILNDRGVALIEDCAHTMGARWDDTLSGSYGIASCFSTQTYKHINSGEGGFLVSNDPAVMSRATVLSGSYMLYDRHLAGPSLEHFETTRFETPNMSGRLDNLRASILRPQLKLLDDNAKRWNERYDALAAELLRCQHLVLPTRPEQEYFVGSSLQFRIPSYSADDCQALLARCSQRGVELKWFGADNPAGYTSNHTSWRYVRSQSLPETDRILSTLFDLRLPLTFSVEDCECIGRIIVDCVDQQ